MGESPRILGDIHVVLTSIVYIPHVPLCQLQELSRLLKVSRFRTADSQNGQLPSEISLIMLLCKGDPWKTGRAAYGGGTSMPQLGHIRIVAYSQFVAYIISSHNPDFNTKYSIKRRVCVDLHRFMVKLAFLVLCCSWYSRDLPGSPSFCSRPISSQLVLIINLN